MKKFTALALTLAVAAFMLTGCFASDTNIKIGVKGNIAVEATQLVSESVIKEQIGNSISVKEALTKQKEAWEETAKSLKGDNEGVTMEIIEKGGEKKDMSGMKVTMKFKDWNQMTTSQFYAFLIGSSAPTKDYLGLEDTDENGIKYDSKAGLFGTKYSVKGKIEMADILALQNVTDASAAKGAVATFKITAPLFTARSNSQNKGIFKTTHIWTTTADAPSNVDFSAFVINPVVLIETLIIIGLLVCLILLLLKKKDENSDNMEQISMDSIDSILAEENTEPDFEENEVVSDVIEEEETQNEETDETEE